MLRRTVAAAVATTTVALALGAGPLASPALAWSNCTASKGSGPNTGSDTMTLTTTTPGEILASDVVKLVPSNTAGGAVTPITGTLSNVAPVSLTQVNAAFTFAADAPEAYTITVYDGTNPATEKGTCGSYSLTNTEALSATSISTPVRGAGSSTSGVTLSGTGFAKGLAVSFQSGGTADPTVTWTTSAVAAHTLTGVLAVDAAATPGARTIVLTGVDGVVTSIPNGLTVTAAPTVTTVAPTALGQGATGQSVTITGTGFGSGAQVSLLTGGTSTPAPGVTVSAVTVDSPTQLTATVSASGTATTGALDLKVTNTDAGSATKAGALTITPKPAVTAVSPRKRDQGTTTQTLTVTGTGFVTTAPQTVFAFPADGITIASQTVDSPTQATLTVDVADTAAVGDRVLTATNADGGTSTCSTCFGVSAKPVVSSVSPPSLARGAVQTVTITGQSFKSTIAKTDLAFGPGVTVNSATWVSATQLSANLTVAADAAQGTRTVSVTNPADATDGGGTGTSSTAFAVTAFTVTGATPSSAANTGSAAVTVNGSGFTAGMAATVTLVPHGAHPATQGDVVATTVTNVTTSSLSATFPLGAVAPGSYDLSVVDSANGDAGSCSACFTVTGGTPTVSAVSPATRGAGATSEVLTLTGTSFSQGTTVAFAGGVTVVGSPTVVSSTQLTVTVNVPAGTPAGAANPTVTTYDNKSGSCSGTCFAVTAAPVVTSASPSALAAGAGPVAVTFTGTGFQVGQVPTLALGAGVTVANVAVTSATSVTADVTVNAGATAGTRSITVTNPDHGTSTTASAFTVDAPPTVTSLSEPSRQSRGTTTAVTLTGTHFASGIVVSFGAGVTVGSATVNLTGDQLSVPVTVSAGAAAGPRDVTVTNTDHGTFTLTGGFTVLSDPTVTSVDPASVQRNAAALAVTVTGTSLVTGATLTLPTGVTLHSGSTPTANGAGTTLSFTVDVAGNAPLGAGAVTVTNPDGGTATKAAALTVVSDPTITSVTPATVQRNAAALAVTVTGTSLVTGATLTLPTGVTLHSGSTPTANGAGTTLSFTVDVAGNAPLGAGAVTVTNPDGGTVTKAAALTVVSDPTITSVTPSSVQRGRVTYPLTVSGTGLVTGAAVALPTGVSVHPGSTPTANGAGTTLSFSVDVAGNAPLATGAVTVTNPDGGTVTKTGALTVRASRTFKVTLAGHPVSGQSRTVTVTALDSDGTTTDTSYVGTPTLSTTDTHGTGGSCTAATQGVASCTGTTFGDLGTQQVSAAGTGTDADLSGFAFVTVAPTSLVFTTAPTTAARGTAVSFTVVPTAANGGTVTGYDAARTLVTTGGSSPASGSALACPGSSCTFSVSWATGGTKSVQVTDGTTTSPAASVVVPTPTTLSSRLSSTIVYQNGSSSLSGVLVNAQTGTAVVGVPVRIYRKSAPATSYTLVATVTTNSYGTYAYTAGALTRNTVLLAQYMGSQAYSGSKTSRLVYVRAGLSASFPTSVTAGRAFTLNGRTSPTDPGAKVYLYEKRADGSVVVLSSAYVRSDGTFSLTRSTGLARGKHTVWVVVGSTALNYTNLTARHVISAV